MLDASILSDDATEYAEDGSAEAWGFTGAFFGLWSHDLSEGRSHVDVDQATYRGDRSQSPA